MTAFDALMPNGAGVSAVGTRGARPGGDSGDWRQAVEQAQARSWLRDRTLAAGQEQGQPGSRVSVSPAASLADRAVHAAAPFADPPDPVRDAVNVPGADPLPPPALHQVMGAGAGETALPAPWVAVASLAAAPANPQGCAALPAAAAGQGEVLRSARARKQSIHTESAEHGVSIWIRDASLNSREARHLAAAIASSLSSGRQDVASLYLNGRPVMDGLQLSSPPSSE